MTTHTVREAASFPAVVTAAFFVRNAAVIAALAAFALISLLYA